MDFSRALARAEAANEEDSAGWSKRSRLGEGDLFTGSGATMDEIWYAATNQTRGRVLADRTRRAESFGARLRGLLGRSALQEGEGLHLDPCNGIHTFFMRFPIDALFLDREGVIVLALDSIVPWRASRVVLGARSVLELPAGTIRDTATQRGDRVEIRPLDRVTSIR